VLLLASALIICFVFYCYWPLTRFFFSQDDFYFLDKASSGFRASMEQFFNARPGHFRPLTKGLYFLVAWPLFGLNPVPYHVVSLALHALNSILAGVLLRRLGISTVMSWIAVVLFAANVSHLEAVAWISCAQQLFGATFAFAALIWGVDALAKTSRRYVVAATVAYALALGSYEQTLAVPLVLILWQWMKQGWREAAHACRGTLLPMLLLLLVYGVYVIAVRGLPHDGPYAMWIGRNVIDNISEYAGSVFAIWLIYPYLDLPPGLRGSHIVWLALIAWYVIRRKPRELGFGCATFVLFLAPVLLMHYHVFSFHLYLPAIGAWYLLGGIGDSVTETLRSSWQRSLRIATACVVVLAAVGSTLAVRKNVTNYYSEDVKIPQLRVLRRAALADRVCADVVQHWQGSEQLTLVYVGDPAYGNWGNIKCALSDGRALRLVLHQPNLVVAFVLPAESGAVTAEHLMIVTELGQTLTPLEYQRLQRYQPSAYRVVVGQVPSP
jgi:hypothetical protein